MNVLFLNGGRRIELIRLFRNALKRLDMPGRVLATDIQPNAPALHEADAGRLLPPSGSPEFLSTLLSYCGEEKIDLLVPTIDPDLLALSRLREPIENAGIKILLSSIESIKLCRNKRNLMGFLRFKGIPVPNDFALEKARDQPLPLFIKPNNGSSSINVFRVDTPMALEFFSREYVQDPLIQEFIDGKEFTVDLLMNNDSIPSISVPRRRIKVRGGEVSIGQVKRNLDIERLAGAAATAIGLKGPCNVQIIQTLDRAVVIEINPRIGGGLPLSAAAGAPIIEQAILQAIGQEVNLFSADIKDGLTMMRYDDSIFV
jgi:carbamoyl-phosphate synthase large subunit